MVVDGDRNSPVLRRIRQRRVIGIGGGRQFPGVGNRERLKILSLKSVHVHCIFISIYGGLLSPRSFGVMLSWHHSTCMNRNGN
jgi:hypothetical protein